MEYIYRICIQQIMESTSVISMMPEYEESSFVKMNKTNKMEKIDYDDSIIKFDPKTWIKFFERTLTPQNKETYQSKPTKIVSCFDPDNTHYIAYCHLDNDNKIIQHDIVWVYSLLCEIEHMSVNQDGYLLQHLIPSDELFAELGYPDCPVANRLISMCLTELD